MVVLFIWRILSRHSSKAWILKQRKNATDFSENAKVRHIKSEALLRLVSSTTFCLLLLLEWGIVSVFLSKNAFFLSYLLQPFFHTFPPPEAVLFNNNNESSLLPVNLRARIGAYSAGSLIGRDNPDLSARIRNTIRSFVRSDNALAAAVAADNMLLPSIPLRRLRPIATGRGGESDAPPQAVSQFLRAVSNVRPGTPTTARIRPPIASATRPNRTVVSLSGATVQSSINRSGSATVQPSLNRSASATVHSSLNRSASARSSGSLPIRVVSSRPTPPTSTSSLANRSSTTRPSNVSLLNAVQSGETSTQNSILPPSITVTAKQIPRQDGQLQYHITNSAGLFFGNDVLPQVMEKVTTHFRRAHALALHRNEETPTEVTFRMSTP